MEAFLASTPTLKDVAKRAFVAYFKSVFLMKNKKVFKVQELDPDTYSKSLGLAIPPRVRFIEKRLGQKAQKDSNDLKKSDSDLIEDRENKIIKFNDSDDAVSEDEAQSNDKTPFSVGDNEDSDDGDIFKVKRQDHDIDMPTEMELTQLELSKSKKKKPLTRAAIAKKIIKKNIVANKKIVFDDSGEAILQATKEKQSELALEYENEDIGGIDLDKARMVLKEEDKYDKALFKEKVKAKKKEKKKKLKQKKLEAEEEDDFGTDSEGDGPDLSWLPDPDKIYGSRAEGESDDNLNRMKEEIAEIESSEEKFKKIHK